jgi:hypothetical protein
MFKHFQTKFLYVSSSSSLMRSSQANSFFNLMLQDLMPGYFVCKLTPMLVKQSFELSDFLLNTLDVSLALSHSIPLLLSLTDEVVSAVLAWLSY